MSDPTTRVEQFYNVKFWEKNGWCSCFECDIIFTDLEKLFEHQNLHTIQKNSTKKKECKLPPPSPPINSIT